MADVEVELTPGRRVNLGVTTPSVTLGVDTPSITLDVHAVVGGGGGGASALDDLTDVDVSTYTPRAGQSLVFDGTTWENNYPPLIFVTYLWPVGVTDFTTLFGGDPATVLPTVGIDGVWWFHDEPNTADNGIWVSTASPGTAEQWTPQPGGLGASIFTYQKFDGAGFVASYLTWMNTEGGDATDPNNWAPVYVSATNVLHTKTTPADWTNGTDESLDLLLDELAARITALEP